MYLFICIYTRIIVQSHRYRDKKVAPTLFEQLFELVFCSFCCFLRSSSSSFEFLLYVLCSAAFVVFFEALRAHSSCGHLCRSNSGGAYLPEGQTCHFRKRETSMPAEGPAYRLGFARNCELPLRALQAQKWHVVRGSRTLGAA